MVFSNNALRGRLLSMYSTVNWMAENLGCWCGGIDLNDLALMVLNAWQLNPAMKMSGLSVGGGQAFPHLAQGAGNPSVMSEMLSKWCSAIKLLAR
jgi:hypothetical protein